MKICDSPIEGDLDGDNVALSVGLLVGDDVIGTVGSAVFFGNFLLRKDGALACVSSPFMANIRPKTCWLALAVLHVHSLKSFAEQRPLPSEQKPPFAIEGDSVGDLDGCFLGGVVGDTVGLVV